MNRIDNIKNQGCWCCCTEEHGPWNKLREKYFSTEAHLDNLMAARIALEKEQKHGSQANFSFVFQRINTLIPAHFFYDVFTAYSLNVDYKHYLKSALNMQIIDRIKQICFTFLLKKQFEIAKKFIKHLNKLADKETASFKYHLQDAVKELQILIESRKNTHIETQKNDALKNAHRKIENLTKTILGSISKNQYASETLSTGTAHVTVVNNEKGKKVVFKAYSEPAAWIETETVQDMASIYFNEAKAFPPSIRVSEHPLMLEYKQEELALINQGYSLRDVKSNSSLLNFMKQGLGLSKKRICKFHGFIVPVRPIPEDIFSSKWDYTDLNGKIVTDCSFQQMQQLFLLNQIEIKNIHLPQGQILEKLESALKMGWTYLPRRAILVQCFVKMMSLAKFNMHLRKFICSHLSEGNLLRCVKIGEWGGFDMHSSNIGVKIVTSKAYKQLSTVKDSYTRNKQNELVVLHEDYLRHVGQNSFIDTNDKSLISKKLLSTFITLDDLKYRFVFFDQDHFFPNNNLIIKYTFENKICYNLPVRIEIEGIEQPLSEEDLTTLIHSLDNDIEAYNILVSRHGLKKIRGKKIAAFIKRIFSRTEFLALYDRLKNNESDLEALMARLERFILSPRSPFSTIERLQYLAKWYTLKIHHEPLEKVMLFRNFLLKITTPSCLILLKTMYFLLANIRELIATVYPDYENVIVGNFRYPLSDLIKTSNERFKDAINIHRNAFIQSFLKPSETFWKKPDSS